MSIIVIAAGLLGAPAAGAAPDQPGHTAVSHPIPTAIRALASLVNQQAIHQEAAQQQADAVAAYVAALQKAQAQALAAQPAQAAEQALDARVARGDNPADATSVGTSDWACIRNAESGGNYTDVSGAYGVVLSTWADYGFSGTPGQASASTQDAFALRLFALNGYKFAGTWNNPCTMGGPLR